MLWTLQSIIHKVRTHNPITKAVDISLIGIIMYVDL